MDLNEGVIGRCLRVKEKKIYDDPNVDDEIEGKRKFDVEEKLDDPKFDQNTSDVILELEGKDFDLKYIQEHGFNSPVLFKNRDGLGLRVPDSALFSIIDVKSYVGARRMIDVFDCDTHEADKMSVHQWVRYYTGTERERVLNVTSLEFSHTGLDRLVECPSVVQEELDWVWQLWPKHLISQQKDTTNSIDNMKYPKVRKYVLMSVAGCYTDFHIDFGGTSVWYHILKGSKVFWLIPPTDENLQIYERWMLSERQQDVFFGDLVKDCCRVQLVAGDTFMIPTGWIHGVYTPDDSLVFGGNYLHSFNIPMQLRAFNIEENTHVPRHLRFPFYAEIHWYVIKSYVDALERDLDERRMLEFEDDADDADDGVFKLVKEEMNETKSEKNKPKWQCVYLTIYELEGLKQLCEHFRNWPPAKLNYPKDLSDNNTELLDRLEELLQYHEDDDQILACRGINIFKQLEADRNNEVKLAPTSPLNTPLNKQTPPKYPTPPKTTIKTQPDQEEKVLQLKAKKKVVFNEKSIRRDKKKPAVCAKKKKIIRRVRCHECEGCTLDNCNKCKFCLDMVKNGGQGRLRQSCALRFCQDPQLPNYAECKICRQGKHVEALMECSLCAEIIHPNCMEKKSMCKISKKINNSWECPNCCELKDAEEFSMDQVGGIMSDIKQKWQKQILASAPKKNSNGHVTKVQNLKQMIQNVQFQKNKKKNRGKHDIAQPGSKRKVKIEPEDSEDDDIPLAKKKSVKAEKDDSSDDEPLIKKTNVNTKEKVTNGHTNKAELRSPNVELKSPKLIEIHKPINVVRPAPITLTAEYCVMVTGENQPLERKIWIHVFTYLDIKDISLCMLVCRTWNQWCLAKVLWYEINLANKCITSSVLSGVVRRQPAWINLSSTNISGKQIEWLLKRLPRLEGLDISLNTASAVSALMRVTCPPLKSLSLSWCAAIFDRFITQILSPVRSSSANSVSVSRLQFLEDLDLTGCDISNECIEYVFRSLKHLRRLDVSHCTRVSESCLLLVTDETTVCKDTLEEVVCIGCPQISEDFISRIQNKNTRTVFVLHKS